MNRQSLVTLLCISIAVCLQAVHSGENKPGGDLLVPTEWLKQHLNDPSVVVLHVAFARGEYVAGHIPGARFVPWQSLVTPPPQPPGSGLTSELPPVAQLDSLLESVGVSDDSHIVISGALVSAARLFWTIEYLGFTGRLSILDGGLDAWREEKGPLTTEIPVVARGTFTPRPRTDVVVDADWVHAHLNAPKMKIVDARFAYFYAGADSGGMARAGHLPGAVNLPYSTLTKELSKYRDAKTMKHLFEDAGVKSGDQVVTYCHVGQTASVVYVAARLLGYDVRIYDGSFQDWAKRSELPIEGAPDGK
jgi:thiosulfate/3-mercaptopyruvate sulfurtransferase